MAKDIYELLVTLCKHNPTNEEYTFKLIPFFQIHCKYIPEAIDCLIHLTSNNEKILMALSENLKIDFDYEKKKEQNLVDESRAIKILINLYDQEPRALNEQEEEKIPFRQHEKITTKPINLIIFFMNLIWEEDKKPKSNFLKFLRSICRFENKGISLNQENIFKIYKKYSQKRQAIRYDQHFKSGSIKLPEPGKEPSFEYDVSEQLKFYSELSFGRNFLWKKELIPHFSNYYLLQNIWSQGDLKEFPILRSCFCQLAMSLYIDHEPLQRKSLPNYCRLFIQVGEEVEEKVFDEENNQENEIVMYKSLINNLELFLKNISASIENLYNIYSQNDKTARKNDFKITKKNGSILQNPLLLNSIELLFLLIELNLYESLSKTDSYKDMMPFLLNILIYDLKNLEYFTACAYTLQEQNEKRNQRKKNKDNRMSGLSAVTNVAKSLNKQISGGGGEGNDDMNEEIDYELDSQEIANPLEQSKLYDNHIMRGQIKLHNQLEEMNYSDSIGYQTEIKVKLKVLDILEHFMDLRHNYLMTNVLKFYKDHIAGIEDEKDDKAKQKILEKVKEHVKGFFPNIPLTGIDVVDKYFEPKDSSNFNLNFKIKSKKQNQPKEKFNSYIKPNYIHYQDFNNLLSASIERELSKNEKEAIKDEDEQKKMYEDPIATCLPSLLSSFLIIYDENLEKRLLKILIRMYNQRYDLLQNIEKLQIIFDKQTFDLFRALEDMYTKLNKYVEQCEVWFTTFAQNKYEDHPISYLIELLENLNNGFFKCNAKQNGKIDLLDKSKRREQQKVDKEKQKIYQYLKINEPIIQLLKEGMHHFDQYILQDNYPVDKKPHLIRLFELVYEFLIYFTVEFKENQKIVKKFIPLICLYLKYDLGQSKLICSIYKDNAELSLNIDKALIDTFLELIETEGRQIHFLDIFDTILKIRNKYIFDNQLLILNTFLPQKMIGEREYNLLYANGSNQKQFRFYLEDVCKSLEKQKLNDKLKDVDYRDTFRDEPFLYHIKILNLLIQTSYIQLNDQKQNNEQNQQIIDEVLESPSKVSPEKMKKNLFDNSLALYDPKDDGDFEYGEDEEDDQNNQDNDFDDQVGEQQQKKQLRQQKMNEYIDKLKEKIKFDTFLQESKFNILVTRLKRIFNVYDLLQMLGLEDSYGEWNKHDELNQKQVEPPLIKETEGKQGKFQEALADKEEIERKKKIEESKKEYLSITENKKPEFIEQKEKFKEGMNLLKPHLLDFMRKVHIQSETVISSNSEMIVQQKEIANFFDKEGIKINCLSPKNKISQQYVSFIFDYLVPFLFDYHKKFVKRGIHNQHIQEDEERRDDKSLDILIDKISLKLPLLSPKLSQVQKDRVTYVIKTIRGIDTKVKFVDLSEKKNNLSPPKKIKSDGGEKKFDFKGIDLKHESKEIDINDRDISQYIDRGEAPSDNNEDDNTKLIKIQKFQSAVKSIKIVSDINQNFQTNLSELKKHKLAERNWKLFKIILNEETQVQQQVNNEKIALAEAIVRVKKIVKIDLAKDLALKPDMFKLIKKFIKFLIYAPEDPQNKDTIISLISVLKEVINSQGIKNNKEEDEDEEKQNEKRQKIQNMFDQLGAMKMILMVLSQNNPHLDNQLIITYLSFANTLLEGGNNQIQNTIYNFFMGYQKSEIIFSRFNQIIRKQIRFIEQKSNNKDQQDFIESEDENQSMIELLERVLRFLQLCVEGHYIDLQNYLRKQENSRNNYDMVQAVADLLKAYYYGDCTQKMYDNMIFCLDTLSEFVQGPCQANQDAVSDSKFFDIASDLFSKKKVTAEVKLQRQERKKKNRKIEKLKKGQLVEQYRKSKEQPLTQWMIGRLQNKVLILVLSLLESREVKSNCDIIKRIMRNLPLYVLQRHLIKIYKRFDDVYQNKFNRSSLSHLEKDPRCEDDQKFFRKLHKSGQDIDMYLECILQNGFQIYFLLSYYIESDPKLGGEMVKAFKSYEKKIMNNEKGDLENLLTGDNIIGQLISFARSLIESILKYAESLKEQTYDALLSQIKDENDQKKQTAKQEKRSKILKNAMNFFASNSAHIDIVRNEMLELVYFIRLPATNCLPKEVKTNFHDKCDRSNIKTKQSELIKEAQDIIEICKHEYSLQILFSSNKVLALFANYVKLWKDLSFFISLILNFFILFSFQTKHGVYWDVRVQDYNLFDSPKYTLQDTKYIFGILGIIMIVCSNFVLLFFLFKNVPLIFQKVMNNGEQLKNRKSCLGKTYVLLVKFFEIMITFLQDFQVLYYIAYGALAVIGTVFHPFFFTFHLTAILMRYPTLKNVVMSIYLPRRQLLLTFLLFVVLEYCFSVWGYSMFAEEYAGRCESLLYCFLTTFDNTFKPNGGVGGFLAGNLQAAVSANTAKYSFKRFIFDQLFQYVMLNIMINIVVGIIIDTFGLLREQSNEQNQDMLNYCFICGIEKTTFDRKSDSGKGFIKHIKFNHYMWNYVHFISYLEWKEKSEYTGIESYVDDLNSQNDTSWMPFKMAREIGEGDSDDDEVDLNQLSQIEKKQKGLVKEINTLIESMDELSKEKKEKRK